MLKRIGFFGYGVACHAMFLAVYAWMAAFVGGFVPGLRPTLDGAPTSPFWLAVLVDVALIAAFAVPHSVMARQGFKRWWTKFVPAPIERSTYVLIANVLMIALLALWQPLGGHVWTVTDPTMRVMVWSLFAAGWLIVPTATLMTNHFDLFGTRQVWLYLRGKEYTPLKFGVRGFYKYVRHPLYVGWLLAFWATPTMTVSHLVFAGLLSAYILFAIKLEERDLVSHYGAKYERYREEVGGLVPRVPTRGKGKLVGRAGTAALVLFGLKGVAWLVVGAVGAMNLL